MTRYSLHSDMIVIHASVSLPLSVSLSLSQKKNNNTACHFTEQTGSENSSLPKRHAVIQNECDVEGR